VRHAGRDELGGGLWVFGQRAVDGGRSGRRRILVLVLACVGEYFWAGLEVPVGRG